MRWGFIFLSKKIESTFLLKENIFLDVNDIRNEEDKIEANANRLTFSFNY